MKTHDVSGGNGVRIHVVETGNPNGHPILFIHGFSQCSLSWAKQLDSDLARDYRLAAMDLRGHGVSEKPRDAYGDSKLWADDVNSVIQTLNLDQPILVGWSYGPLVILDYVRHYGEADIAGMHFIGGITKLGSEAAFSVITPEFLAEVPAMMSSDPEETARGLNALFDLCINGDLSVSERYLMLGFNLSVPPYVRQALFARAFDNEDLLPTLRKPVLITQGLNDCVVKPIAAEQHKAAIPHAELDLVEGWSHAPFWDDPVVFNRRLAEFVSAAHRASVAPSV